MNVPTLAAAESVFRQFKGIKGQMDRARKVNGQWDTSSTYPGSELENHHAVFAHLMDRMEQAGLLKPGINRDMSPSLLTSWAKHRGIDPKNIHATIDPMVGDMFRRIDEGEIQFGVETVKATLAAGYRDAGLPSVSRAVELFLSDVKKP